MDFCRYDIKQIGKITQRMFCRVIWLSCRLFVVATWMLGNCAYANGYSKHWKIYLREYFEEIRANYFPTLPSRKSCLGVCREDSLEFWKKILIGDCQLFEVPVTGVAHCADQKYLPAEVLPCEIIREKAFNYWTRGLMVQIQ